MCGEMVWIMTQYKNSLIHVKEVTVEGRCIVGIVNRGIFTEWSKTLGTYDSSDRAIEILGEIQVAIEKSNGNNPMFAMPEV